MLKRLLLLLLDLTLVLAATILALLIRENLDPPSGWFPSLLPYLVATGLVTAPVLCIFGLDRSVWRMSSMTEYLKVCGAALTIVTLGLGAAFTHNRLDGVSRSLPVLQIILMVCSLVGVRVLARLRHARRHRLKGSAMETVALQTQVARQAIVVVGMGRVAELYLQSIEEFGSPHASVVGIVSLASRHAGRSIHNYPVLGEASNIEGLIQQLEVHGVFVDRVVVTVPFAELSAVVRQNLINIGKTTKIDLEFFADQFARPASSRIFFNPLTSPTPSLTIVSDAAEASPFVSIKAPAPQTLAPHHTASRPVRRAGVYWSVKRGIDCAIAFALILILFPVFVAVAVIVAVDVGLPLWFWQQRPGVGLRPFRVYKFRSMRGAYDNLGRRVSDEDRSSVIGRFLRRMRLDELPQLYNILVGQMSFVGPRPLLAIDQCDDNRARLSIRPGLTGWAQVNGGRLLSIPDKMALDMWYLDNASFTVDARILVATLSMLLFGERTNGAAIAQAKRLADHLALDLLNIDTAQGRTPADKRAAKAFTRALTGSPNPKAAAAS